MTPYYPVRDGHPSMFAPEGNAEKPIFSISRISESADGANDAGARLIHNAHILTTAASEGEISGLMSRNASSGFAQESHGGSRTTVV